MDIRTDRLLDFSNTKEKIQSSFILQPQISGIGKKIMRGNHSSQPTEWQQTHTSLFTESSTNLSTTETDLLHVHRSNRPFQFDLTKTLSHCQILSQCPPAAEESVDWESFWWPVSYKQLKDSRSDVVQVLPPSLLGHHRNRRWHLSH